MTFLSKKSIDCKSLNTTLYMDKTYPLNSYMVVQLLEVDKDLFCPKKEHKK